MKRKITEKAKARLAKKISKKYLEQVKLWLEFMAFAVVGLIVFSVALNLTGGRAIPYVALLFILSAYLLFGRGVPVIKLIPVIIVALIFIAMAVDMFGK